MAIVGAALLTVLYNNKLKGMTKNGYPLWKSDSIIDKFYLMKEQ